MAESTTSSFDQLLKTPETEMLSAALPYVSSQIRKPLAVYIKSTEIRRILFDFDQEEILSACGLEDHTSDPEAMLKAMKTAGGKNSSVPIDQLLQMMNMIKTYQKIHEMMQHNPEIMSFLNNMLNQPPASTSSQPDKNFHSDKSNSPAGMDSSDMMNLLTQMLKNSR